MKHIIHHGYAVRKLSVDSRPSTYTRINRAFVPTLSNRQPIRLSPFAQLTTMSSSTHPLAHALLTGTIDELRCQLDKIVPTLHSNDSALAIDPILHPILLHRQLKHLFETMRQACSAYDSHSIESHRLTQLQWGDHTSATKSAHTRDDDDDAKSGDDKSFRIAPKDLIQLMYALTNLHGQYAND